ncbi:hypothetical protein [Ilumatobacter sp.]|uniref:hypothetical protein n=1 Tax=Ilumatobacter sp. TaxID=1967498 RepID=UPI003AF79A4B
MAADIDVDEQVLVLRPGGSVQPIADELRDTTSCRVSHQYGSRVLVSEGGQPLAAVKAERPQEVAVGDSRAALPGVYRRLDREGNLGLNAFDLRQSESYRSAKAARFLAESTWDNDQVQAPDYHGPQFDAEEEAALAGAATSARLTGSVAVGLVMVGGPGNLAFTDAEQVKIVAEVQNGLSWLGAQTPAGISWVYDLRPLSLTVQPGASNLSFSQKEALWRDPAMQALGYGSGLAGVRDYIEDLRSAKNTSWSYCAFVTKYPIGHFAYASIGGPRLVMDPANDGWGIENFDRVFAHETGHIFGAPDEYAASNCNCGGSWGFGGRPNGNCATCAPGGGVDCIMKSNSWAMCGFTPSHLGFLEDVVTTDAGWLPPVLDVALS